VVFFDMNFKGGSGAQQNTVANFKKLLSMLSRMELTQGYSEFLGNLRI
jgi:hypothetical protein